MSDESSTPDIAEQSLDADTQRAAVRDRYGQLATTSGSCCHHVDLNKEPPHSGEYLDLGCGDPTAIANLETGDTVLDLGSGGGFDCFRAAKHVGSDGHVIGVDMTPEMVDTARERAEARDTGTVEFRLGEIEHLPVANTSIDVVLSDCVINLSPDKSRVFRKAYRALRPGGNLVISDIVATTELPTDVQHDPDAVAACIGGATAMRDYERLLTACRVHGDHDRINDRGPALCL
ncbi:MAG: methyltransferase domain-containing protein [Halobacteriales archaeon]